MTTQKNGATIPQKETVKETAKPTLAVVPVKAPAPTPPKENSGEDLPPLEDRIYRLNQLFEIQNRYNRFETSLTKLKAFNLKKESENIVIKIYDDVSREDFRTANPEVVAEVLAFLEKTITAHKKAMEPLLKW